MNSYLIALLLAAIIGLVMSDQTSYLKRTGQKYLEDKAAEEGVIKLKSGMLVEILKESDKGTDARSPNAGDSCKVTYLGTFKDGSKFDGT